PPSTAVIPHEKNPRIPKISEAMARPLVSGARWIAATEEIGDGGGCETGTGGTAAWALSASVNSGKAAAMRQPRLPSASSRVWETTRRSAIHCRTVSADTGPYSRRSEEHTSELQSPYDLVCRLLLEKKNQK